jgi:hypothetical protein
MLRPLVRIVLAWGSLQRVLGLEIEAEFASSPGGILKCRVISSGLMESAARGVIGAGDAQRTAGWGLRNRFQN